MATRQTPEVILPAPGPAYGEQANNGFKLLCLRTLICIVVLGLHDWDCMNIIDSVVFLFLLNSKIPLMSFSRRKRSWLERVVVRERMCSIHFPFSEHKKCLRFSCCLMFARAASICAFYIDLLAFFLFLSLPLRDVYALLYPSLVDASTSQFPCFVVLPVSLRVHFFSATTAFMTGVEEHTTCASKVLALSTPPVLMHGDNGGQLDGFFALHGGVGLSFQPASKYRTGSRFSLLHLGVRLEVNLKVIRHLRRL